MASSLSKHMSDLNDGKDNTCTVYKCIHCNTQLDGDSNPLVCKNCLLQKKKQLKINTNGNQTVIMDVVKEKTITLCSSCQENETEVKCIQCLTSICAFCFLKSHNKHDLKILGELETDIKTNLNEKLHDLKQLESHVCTGLNKNDKQEKNLKMSKKLTDEKIYVEINKLHEKLCERSNDLKNMVENYFLDFINKEEQIINNTNKRVQYNRVLTEAILKHDKKSEIVFLSKPILNELKRTQQLQTVISKELSRCQPDIQFTCDETLEKCISSIRAIGLDMANTSQSTDSDSLENNSDEPSKRD